MTGLSNSSAGLIAYYHRDTDTTPTQVNLVNMTLGSYTSGGFADISDTFMPGWYQFCPPNNALALGARSVGFSLSGAVNMAQVAIEIDMAAGADIANDVWNVMLPGSYSVGTAGYILGNLMLNEIAQAVWATNLPGAFTLPEAGFRVGQYLTGDAYRAIDFDNHPEPTSVPAANTTLEQKINWLFALARNKITQTSAIQTVYEDNGSSVLAASAVSDDGTLFTRGKFQ